MLNTYTLTIADIDIQVIRKKVKTLRFSVHPPFGAVRVSVPLSTKEESVRLAIQEKLDWIKGHHEKFRQQSQQNPRLFQSGEQHYFQSQPYELEVIENAKRSSVILSNNKIILSARPNASQLQRQTILYDWYRQELRILIAPMLIEWQAKLEVNLSKWGIKTMKTRWGSCNPSTKRIWFNTELAKSSIECVEYVVVHELVHLLEASHNHRFKHFMTTHLPNWRETKKQLVY